MNTEKNKQTQIRNKQLSSSTDKMKEQTSLNKLNLLNPNASDSNRFMPSLEDNQYFLQVPKPGQVRFSQDQVQLTSQFNTNTNHNTVMEEYKDTPMTPQLSQYGSFMKLANINTRGIIQKNEGQNPQNLSPSNRPFRRLQSMRVSTNQKLGLQNQFSYDERKQSEQPCMIEQSRQSEQCNDKFANLLKYIRLKPLMMRLVHRLESRRKRLLKSNHLFFINDKAIINGQSSYSQEIEKKSILIKIVEVITQIFSCFLSTIRFPIINPANFYKLLWDILNLVCIFFLIFVIPLALSFQIFLNSLIDNWLISLVQFITVLDIIISFNTAYYQKGIMVEDRLKIAMNYFLTQFHIDIIAFIVLIILSHVQSFQYYHVLLLFYLTKIKNISVLTKKLEESFNFNQSTTLLFQLLRLLLTVLLISHLFACLWIFIYGYQKGISDDTHTWLDKINMSQQEWTVKYLMAFYFCTVTMVTVGYGDITPQTKLEYLLSIFTIMIACGVFGYSVNFLGKIFQALQEQQNQIKKNMNIINQYMQKKNVSNALKYQIREYLEYIWSETLSGQGSVENKIISSLSETLQSELLYESNKIVLDDFPLFKKNFSTQCLTKMVPLITENRFSPEEVITTKDEEDDCSLYFIESGQVEMCIYNSYKQHNFKRIITLKKGQWFGFQSFLTGERRNITIRSIDFTSLLQIKRKEFLDMINNFEYDYERFCMLKDSVYNEQSNLILDLPCICCGLKDHILENCFYIHHIPNQSRIKGVINQSFDQKRGTFKRKYYKQNPIKQFNSNYDRLIHFHGNNFEDLQIYIQDFQIFNDEKAGLEEMMVQLSQQQIEKYGYQFGQISEYHSSDEATSQTESSIESEELNQMINFKIQLQNISKRQKQLSKATILDIPDDPQIQTQINMLPKESLQKKVKDFQYQKRQPSRNTSIAGHLKQSQFTNALPYLDIPKRDENTKKDISGKIRSSDQLSPLPLQASETKKFVPAQKKNVKYRNSIMDFNNNLFSNLQNLVNKDGQNNQNQQNKGSISGQRQSCIKPIALGTTGLTGLSSIKIDIDNKKQTIIGHTELTNKKILNRASQAHITSLDPQQLADITQSMRMSIKKPNNIHDGTDVQLPQEQVEDKLIQMIQDSNWQNMYFYDFDLQKNFKKYYHKFNMSMVVERYRAKLEKLEKNSKKKKLMSIQRNIITILRHQNKQKNQQINQSQNQQQVLNYQLSIGSSQGMNKKKGVNESSSNDIINSTNIIVNKSDSNKLI